jgi:hypothetical protein
LFQTNTKGKKTKKKKKKKSKERLKKTTTKKTKETRSNFFLLAIMISLPASLQIILVIFTALSALFPLANSRS